MACHHCAQCIAVCVESHGGACSCGAVTKRLRWCDGSLQELHDTVKRLFGVQELASFVKQDCELGLHFVADSSPRQQDASPHEAEHLASTSQLSPGCVLEVRNKLWRAAIRYNGTRTGAVPNSGTDGLRERLYLLLHDQTSSRGAAIIAAVINLAIITSTLSYTYSSLPEYRVAVATDPSSPKAAGIFWHDAVCAALFTVELLLRLISLPDIKSVTRHPSLLLDVAALLPWYIQTFTSTRLAILSVLRVARSVRMLMIFRATQDLVLLLGGTAQRAANMLLLLGCIVTMSICMVGLSLWAFERGEWDSERRMFVRDESIVCPVTCPHQAHFGAYAGCRHEGDAVMLSMGMRPHHALTDCVAVKARSSRSVRSCCALPARCPHNAPGHPCITAWRNDCTLHNTGAHLPCAAVV